MATYELTTAEQTKLDELSSWLGTSGHGAAIAAESGWNNALDNDERIAFLYAWGPWQSFKDWLQGIGDTLRRRWLEIKMVDMILSYIAQVLGG